jgi:hypothetical protein
MTGNKTLPVFLSMPSPFIRNEFVAKLSKWKFLLWYKNTNILQIYKFSTTESTEKNKDVIGKIGL